MKQLTTSSFESLLTSQIQWIDVRAPIEFASGAVPGAINISLLTDDERHQIGITYKEQGQEAAIELGHQLVSGPTREQRLNLWIQAIQSRPLSVIYCFRGGLRSQIVQRWLHEQGIECPIIFGGYKALRYFLLESSEVNIQAIEFHVVSGPTGSGKTEFLYSSGRPFIDLEEIAKHRGSAFGATDQAQPSQANFENELSVQLLKLSKLDQPVLIESESRMIGKRHIPESLFIKIKNSKTLILDVPMQERIDRIYNIYVVDKNISSLKMIDTFQTFRASVKAISRKLGGARTQEILLDLDFSEQEYSAGRGLTSNHNWIRKILTWYYDPLYNRSF